MSMTRAQIATQLLNEMAPKGEKLAYINNREAELLKRMGGAGVDINKTGIKSYFDPGSGRGSVSESLSQAAFGSSGPTFSSDGGSGSFTPKGNFATITKDKGDIPKGSGAITAGSLFPKYLKNFQYNTLLGRSRDKLLNLAKQTASDKSITALIKDVYNDPAKFDPDFKRGSQIKASYPQYVKEGILSAIGFKPTSQIGGGTNAARALLEKIGSIPGAQTLGRALPGIGTVSGIYDVGSRLSQGDYFGAGLGALSAVPFVGIPAAAAQAAYDYSRVNYANGGRSRYGLGKLVKKITQPAKKLIKSDLGKAALTAAAVYYAPTVLGKSGYFSGAKPLFSATGKGGITDFLIKKSLGAKDYLRNLTGIGLAPGAKSTMSPTRRILTALGIGVTASPFFMGEEEEDNENLDEAIARVYGKSDLDIPGIRKAALGYSDPNELYFQLPSAFRSKVANGGIMTLTREEEEQKDINEDSLLNKAKAIAKKEGISVEEALKKIMEYNFEQDITYSGKAEGGLMNLGGNEMDLRGGGFVPIGAKEKADDVPARLSKNEFVFTADAVRAAGGGSIEKGAQKMYNTMKQLENII
jgi:hypothetical protein